VKGCAGREKWATDIEKVQARVWQWAGEGKSWPKAQVCPYLFLSYFDFFQIFKIKSDSTLCLNFRFPFLKYKPNMNIYSIV
jgi:hypothetical protein